MSFILTKNAGHTVKYVIEGYVEHESDLITLRRDYTLGSKVVALDTGKAYVLTAQGWTFLVDVTAEEIKKIKEELQSLSKLKNWLGETTTPLYNGSTANPIVISGNDVTAKPGDVARYQEDQFIFSEEGTWQPYDDTLDVYTKDEVDDMIDAEESARQLADQALDNTKVDKVAGKQLSTEDYTTAEKQKLAGLNASDFATAAQGVKADNAETKNIEQDGRLDTLEDEIIVTKTISGDFLHITDAAAYPAEECITTLEPVQDLHGYSKPWPGGGGKNLLPMTVEGLKAINTTGVWNGNVYTLDGITFTVETDDADNVTGIKANGTSTADWVSLNTPTFTLTAGSYILNGCTNGDTTTYRIDMTPSGTTNLNGDTALSVNTDSPFSVRCVIRQSG